MSTVRNFLDFSFSRRFAQEGQAEDFLGARRVLQDLPLVKAGAPVYVRRRFTLPVCSLQL